MSVKVIIEITSCHECQEFKPRIWEYLNPLNLLMGFWRASGSCGKGNFYIPCAQYGNIPATCPQVKEGDKP